MTKRNTRYIVFLADLLTQCRTWILSNTTAMFVKSLLEFSFKNNIWTIKGLKIV